MKTTRLLTTISAFAALTASANLVTIFEPDFSGTYTGGGANQFTDFYQAEGGTYSTVSIVGGSFQMVTNHDPSLNDPDNISQGDNHSTTQLSRNRDSDALPFVNNFATVQVDWRWNNNEWATGDQTVLNLQIGENFRNGAFNPTGGNGGPAFASINLQARGTEDRFRIGGSGNFDLTKDGDGFYNLSIFAAFNNGTEAVTFTSPTGNYTLAAGEWSLWADNVLRRDGIAGTTTADLENISFGFGVGSNSTFDDAERQGGTYQLSNIVVATIPEPGTLALLGLVGLALAISQRRRRK